MRHIACVLLLVAAATAQTATDIVVADYHKKLTEELAEAGQRHLRLGSSARRAGMVPEATFQFLRAVEVSEGNNPGAVQVLGIMRGLGDAFWKRKQRKPTKAQIDTYLQNARELEEQTRKAHLALAVAAGRAHLGEAQKDHLRKVLQLGGKLEFGRNGKAKLDGAPIPDELAEWLQANTQPAADGQRTFEPAGAAAPKLPAMNEHAGERVLVRTDLPAGDAAEMHALAEAIWPELTERFAGAPARRLTVVVFAKRADYAAYLAACGAGRFAVGTGLADQGTGQTLICGEGLPAGDLHAVLLHELTHLFFFATAPAVMPDWYSEGIAEAVGGQGTFEFDGKTLRLGGNMAAHRLQPLQQQPLPLRELLDMDVRMLYGDPDPAARLRFYAQSWAFVKFLRVHDNPYRQRFEQWEAQCRGEVIGRHPGQKDGDRMPAQQRFDQLFAADFAQLEADFKKWLAALK